MKHGLNQKIETYWKKIMKPAPIFLLINGEADGPHEATEILNRLYGDALDEDENPIEMLSEGTLSCIEGMSGWRSLPETLIWSYAKLLAALPQTADWIKQMDECTLNVRDGNSVIRETLKHTINLEDWQAPDFIWKVIDANVSLLRKHRDYQNREQHWNELAMEDFPALELKLLRREFPTRNWQAEWLAAGGRLYSEKMIARKDDQVWTTLSDFSYPFPPFDFDQSVLLADVSAKEAREAGLNLSPMQLTAIKPFQIVGL